MIVDEQLSSIVKEYYDKRMLERIYEPNLFVEMYLKEHLYKPPTLFRRIKNKVFKYLHRFYVAWEALKGNAEIYEDN